jgi:hypothetical protein
MKNDFTRTCDPINMPSLGLGDELRTDSWHMKDYLSDAFCTKMRDWWKSMDDGWTCLVCQNACNPVVEYLINVIDKQRREVETLRKRCEQYETTITELELRPPGVGGRLFLEAQQRVVADGSFLS